MLVQSQLLSHTGIWAQLGLLDSYMHRVGNILVWFNRQTFLQLIKLLPSQGPFKLRDTGWLGHSDDLANLLGWICGQFLEAAALVWATRGTFDNDLGVDHSTCVHKVNKKSQLRLF